MSEKSFATAVVVSKVEGQNKNKTKKKPQNEKRRRW